MIKRKPTEDEITEYINGLSYKELITDYALQTDDENAIKELRQFLINWIIEYNLHKEIYPDDY